jgi:D-methionine transport system substrate-binding protein
MSTNPLDSTEQELIAPPTSGGPKKPVIITLVVVLALVVAAVIYFVTRPSEETKPVKIGVVGAGEPFWATFKDAAAAEGIPVEIIDFSEYNQPNPALYAGDLDLNQFQHIVFLAQYEAATGNKLTPIGSTAIYPLGLYSKKYAKVEDIPAGEKVSVPTDQSNQARGLLVLQSAGLIELKSGGTIFSDLTDVDEAKSKVKVEAIDASLTPSSLNDVAAAIINNDYVDDSGLQPSDAIAVDDPEDPNAVPYINIWVSRTEDATNPTYLKLVEIYQNNPDVQAGVLKSYSDSAVLLKTPQANLQESLDRTVEQIKAQEG